MDRELFITRLAFINNDEIDTIDKNSSIAYLKALYQCENSIAINYNQEELFTQATAINNLGYNSTFTKIFILDKENLNDTYLDARKRLYKSINTLKEKRNEKIKDIQDYLNKEISLQDNLNNQSFNTKENDVNLILNEVFNIEQFYDKNTNTIVLKTNNIKIIFLDKVNLQDNSNNTSFISMSNLIHIYDNHCDIFAKDRSVLDIKDIEEKYQIDFKSLDIKIFLNSTLLTGSNELPNNPFYFGELDQDNTIKQDTPSYYFSPKDESSGLGRLSIFYKNDELCLLNYSIIENSLNIKLECLSKQSLEYKDLISNTLKEQKTTQVDKKQAIAKLHALLENQNLECIHGGKVILKSNKGKTFKDDGVPIMLESDLLNSSIVACPNTIAGVSVPCTKVVNVKGSLSQKKVNNEYVILQELISACKTDKGFALKVSFTPTKFKFDHSFDPKEGLGEQSKNQIELKEPIIRLHYKSDRFQKDNLPIYNLLINNEKKEQDKALNEFNIDLKDLKDIEDINILNQFKQDFSKDYEFKELNLSFDTNLIKLYFIIPKNIAKVYKSAYKEFENKDLGVGYFTQLHEYDKIIKNALEDNKELNEYHFSFLAPAKMQNLKLQIAQGLDEILEDEDRKQELYVCKFVVVNGVSENNAQEKITHLSNDGQNLLKNIEKLRLKPYNDQNGKEITSYVKGATIGYGHLIGQNEWDLYKNGITLQEADKLFKSDLLPFENAVKNSINSSLAQNEFDALVILCFNIGIDNFKNSSVAKIINGEKTGYKTLKEAWMAWNKSQNKVMQGLINRRNAEYKLYIQGGYEKW
ncbi:glycoside hydrolase family protein [Campylobacter jejuni]|uniref:lysozyme n=14 Tax=Campylobacteraceae TaxID=72294 RepID=UPI0036F6515B